MISPRDKIDEFPTRHPKPDDGKLFIRKFVLQAGQILTTKMKLMYTQIWNKYLPVIRILLKKSATAEQRLGLNRIDFERGGRSRKPTCSFNIDLIKGHFGAVSQSVPARELVATLLDDDVTKSLLRKNHYHISLNADFQLKIINNTPPGETIGAKEAVLN